ncbi:PAS-domain containing protein [Aliiruegeria sabulilitoris]|uniref:PAS-domain containing protein n=1 Tax=Aliiruegeria sabulilitoris TaxID=1510458 RepID=UPI000836483A|nr:PAS-domain containing protein [Aliiruegeria sabulilitoris]NDR57555.1 diguanylate cyclase [Pseudoruegeria sp. M32A2M]
MQQIDLTLGLVMVVSSLGTAMLALIVISYFQPSRKISWSPIETLDEEVVFLFQDKVLVDASPGARALLETGPDFLADWPRFLAVLEHRFAEFNDRIGTLAESQYFVIHGPTGEALEAEWRGGLARIVIKANPHSDSSSSESLRNAISGGEIDTLQKVVDLAPMLGWKEDAAGQVRWANGAYVDLAERSLGEDETISWPLPRIFDHRACGMEKARSPKRMSIELPGSEKAWFDCYFEPVGEETLGFALPADALVRAETSLHEFVQTLTKTFAHLPTGLAVFDRERRLALFNPALADLSALEPQFLSARPTLFEFLDKLRQKQRAPEPKDFGQWRQQIVDLESAAASGTYQETWSLPTGETYRVTGRPHPDGAIAFLFEDISDEMTLTRQFRAELELGQAVLDGVEEAIAVFSASGTLVQFNTAYCNLWDHDPNAMLGDTGIIEATRLWQNSCAPSPAWGDLRDFVGATHERAEWTVQIRRTNGLLMDCRFVPLIGHNTLVSFSIVNEASGNDDAPPKIWTRMPVALR